MAIEFTRQQDGYSCQQVDAVMRGLEEQYGKLYEQYGTLEAQGQEWREQIATLRAAGDKLTEQLQHERSQAAALAARVCDIESEKDNAQRESAALGELERKCAALKAQGQGQFEQIGSLRGANDQLTEQLQGKQGEVELLSARVRELEAMGERAQKAEVLVLAIKDQYDKLCDRYAGVEAQTLEQRTQIDAARVTNDQLAEQLRGKQSEIEQLSAQVHEMEAVGARAQKAEALAQGLKEQCGKLYERYMEIEAQNQGQLAQIDSARAANDQLTERLRGKQGEIDSAHAANDQLAEQLRGKQAEADSARMTNDQLVEQLRGAQARIEQLSERVCAMEDVGERAQKAEDLARGIKDQYGKLYTQYTELETQNRETLAQIDAAGMTNDRLSEQLQAKQGEVEQLSERVREMESVGESARKAEALVQGIKDQYGKLYDQYTALEAQNQEQIARIVSAGMANDQLAEQLLEVQSENERLAARVCEMQIAGDGAKKTEALLEALKEQYNKLFDQYTALETQSREQLAQINVARETNDQLAEHLQGKNGEIVALSERIGVMEALGQSGQQVTAVMGMKEEYAKLYDQYGNLYEQYGAIQAQRQEQIEQITSLRVANDQLAGQLQTKQSEIAQLSEHIQALEVAQKPAADAHSEAMLREVMTIFIRQATAMIADAKKETGGDPA